jgi:hypothetical protein
MDEDCRKAFEKECADWGLDFSSWNGISYDDYATGINAGQFQLGWLAALDHIGKK